MTIKLHWRYLVKPEILFLVGAAMANFPYLLWRFGYPVPSYSFSISYKPLYLWILGYIAFCFGSGYVSFCLCRKVRKPGGLTPFRIRQDTFRICVLITICALIMQIIFACLLYGVLPIWAYFSGYDVNTLNIAQQASGFGQLGLLILTLFILNGLILIAIVSNFKAKGWNRRILWMAVILAVFGSIFTGKTQGFFIFICLLLTGAALARANPIIILFKRLGFRTMSNRRAGFALIGLFSLLVLLHGFSRSIRTDTHKEFNVRYAFDSVVAYLSWPLINTENQVAISGFSGSQFEIPGLLTGLLPYKMRSHLTPLVTAPMPYLERNSPSGFLAAAHWYLGLWGMMAFLFVLGVVCKCLYIKSNKSLFCLLAYSQIAWTLVAAHSYNHFLNLLFIPAPLIAFFMITKIVRSKRVTSKALVYGRNSSVES